MLHPSRKTILVFILALGTGYVVSWLLMSVVLAAPLRLYGFINLTLVALLVAVLLTIWLDKPLELNLFRWPETKPKEKRPAEALKPEPEGAMVDINDEAAEIKIRRVGMFPHEAPSEHWNVDFGDGKQVYEGSALPIWLLAGWATFILWAVIYLVAGLPTAFN
ncbi:MAG: hypothetical protein D6784_18090 [Chloroflexi bacterium]|nr:MAG: hypothetical protein D6784_18090 [Chloroflexota bacterium]